MGLVRPTGCSLTGSTSGGCPQVETHIKIDPLLQPHLRHHLNKPPGQRAAWIECFGLEHHKAAPQRLQFTVTLIRILTLSRTSFLDLYFNKSDSEKSEGIRLKWYRCVHITSATVVKVTHRSVHCLLRRVRERLSVSAPWLFCAGVTGIGCLFPITC